MVRRFTIGRRTAGILGAAVVAITSALAVASLTPASHAGSWSWAANVPGRLLVPHQVTSTVARLGGIDPASLREVVAVTTTRGERFTIVAGSNGAGEACFSFGTRGFAKSFDCLAELPPGLAVRKYLSAGGATPDVVDYVIVAGFARSDVARVVLTLADGSERQLNLNQWRAFAYTASARTEMPTKLTAYGSDGSAVQEDDIAVDPLCGASPCPKIP